MKLPKGRYRLKWGGEFEHLESAWRRLLIVVPVVLGLIFVLLYITYNRLMDVLLVFSGVLFASVGGVLSLWLRDLPFSIPASVGFIALSGVSVQARGVDTGTAHDTEAIARAVPMERHRKRAGQ